MRERKNKTKNRWKVLHIANRLGGGHKLPIKIIG